MNNVKRRLKSRMIPALVLGLLISAIPTLAETGEETSVQNYPTVARRAVTLWSDGTRLAADLFYPKDRAQDEKIPAIVLCHGWGGTKQHLNFATAPQFAAAGYFVIAFDYRGWGESDSRLVVRGEMPKPDENGMVTVTAQAITQLVDPFDQQEDIDAAISFMEGEPGVDRERIGLWGSSFGGGHVVWRAAHDDRVKCIVSQVGAMNARFALEQALKELGQDLEGVHQDRIQRARGELAPVPQPADTPSEEGLTGTPYNARFIRFAPVEHTDKITVPALIIDAEKEHYFDINDHGGRVYRQLKGRVPVEYHVFKDIAHYDIYRGDALKKAMELEIAWFNTHLKEQ